MAEIDPVVLQLLADTDRYRSELRATTRTVDQQLGLQERRVKRLENEFRNSSGAIGNSLRGLAGVLATAFTGRELVGLIDSFTRLQNELKVAGLEGEALANVQGRLFEIANRNGVAINSLADLYGKAAQTGKELGASQGQLLKLTENTALALRISGTSAVQAQGAILGLSQALASGTVRAEEFNQINEGGLRPLLQAAANTERFGGSVAKLRAAVLDGTVSSQEFFSAILAGSDMLQSKASGATLTLSGAFETLNNKLIEYVGGSASASGATGLLAEAIGALANNLDDILEALAVISVVFAGRFVAGALAGGTALRAVSAYASIASTSLAGTALAARGAGAALLTAFGGPVGAAITAIALGIGFVAIKSNEATRATGAYAVAQREAAEVTNRAAQVSLDLAGAHGKVRAEALAAAKAERENTKQKLASARASIVLAQAELGRARAFQNAQNRASIGGGVAGTGSFIQGTGDKRVAQAQGNLAAARNTAASLERSLAEINAAIGAATAPAVASVSAPSSLGKGGGSGGGPSGPSAEEIANRFNSELASIAQQTLSAQARLATSAEERAELELRSIELARLRTLNEIEADADYSAAQKERLAQQVEALAESERETVEIAKRAEIERSAQDLADERARAEADGLRLQYELADTQDERRAIALQILEAEDRYLTSKLEAVLASEAATEAEKERARIALAALQSTRGQREESVIRSESGALDRYIRSLSDPKERAEEVVVRQLERVNDGITDAISKALGTDDPLIKDLLNILLEEVLLKPIAAALQGAQGAGGGGGFFSSIVAAIGSIFGGGRASGGFTAPGKLYRVNEGASPGRVEGFMPTGSGKIIPLGQMNAMQPGGGQAGGVVVVRLALSGDIDAKIDQRAAGVAVEVVRQGAPQIIDAAANETQRRFSRPTL